MPGTLITPSPASPQLSVCPWQIKEPTLISLGFRKTPAAPWLPLRIGTQNACGRLISLNTPWLFCNRKSIRTGYLMRLSSLIQQACTESLCERLGLPQRTRRHSSGPQRASRSSWGGYCPALSGSGGRAAAVRGCSGGQVELSQSSAFL